MNYRTALAGTLILAGVFLLALRPEAATSSCEDLLGASVPDGAIDIAQTVIAGAFVPSDDYGRDTTALQQQAFAALPTFCRIALTSRPAGDSEIKIEVWLPISNWNGRLEAVGEGGLAGFIPYYNMTPALAQGYAVVGTDTGHVGNTARFMPDHPEKLIDFAYRSTHQMAIAAKAIIEAYYTRPPAWSYYNACSGGGRHGLTSAQRYPDDFQGIVAGASSWDQARLDASRIAINLTVNRTPEAQIPTSKYSMIHSAVLQACDADDGVSDSVLENPRACNFDYSELLCTGADGPSCLTAPQVESARTLTSSLVDPVTGNTLLESHLWPGAELQWDRLGGPEPLTNSVERVRNFHLKDPAWEPRLPNIAANVELAARLDNGLVASNNFDLKPFFDRGGKLLMWHGWSDPQVPAQHSVIYYNNVMQTVGPEDEQSIALFMLPGVTHCRGGEGPDTFDKMATISEWVEQGRRPSRILASRVRNGNTDRTRPLCPFPQVASYNGTGDTNDAANFSCAPVPTGSEIGP
jgi:feruloyl esterase